MLSSVPFASPPPIAITADGASSVFVADLNRDGHADVLSASTEDNTIAWHENDGAGSFATEHTISQSAASASWVHAADIDGDGDLDVLSASYGDDTIGWYENTDGAGTFGPRQVITDSAAGAIAVVTADLDGDGDSDAISAAYTDDTIAWSENTDGEGTFSGLQVISSTVDGATSVFPVDLDRDGDVDILSASYADHTIRWFENLDGGGSFGSGQVISSAATGARSVFAADLDRDGDPDVVSASEGNDTIAWYANTDGAGAFGVAQTITASADSPQSVFAADLDTDGDLDIVTASSNDDTVAWFENIAGVGTFGPQQVIADNADGARAVAVADMDADGDVDVVSASEEDDTIRWYDNETIHRSAVFHHPQMLFDNDFGHSAVFVVDLDGDGDQDAIYTNAYYGFIRWQENTDGAGEFELRPIEDSQDAPYPVVAADLDNDGDPDVVAGFFDGVAWYENLDGAGTFGDRQTIASAADTFWLSVADLDNDGDRDVVVASALDDTIRWLENDGAGDFTAQHTITTNADRVYSIELGDLDGDGDLDIASAANGDDTISWFENTDGMGTFGAEQPITTSADGAWSVVTRDLDGDGDLDVLFAAYHDNTVAWFENTGGPGAPGFGPQLDIATDASGATSVLAADLDIDGDLDVLYAAPFDQVFAWHENLDGNGTFGPKRIITDNADTPFRMAVADIDGDGDPDVYPVDAGSLETVWYENRGGQFALETTDTAPAAIIEGRRDDVLRIDMHHRGRSGDHDAELATLDLLFEASEGIPLTTAQANALIDKLHIYADDGSGQFEATNDTLITTIDALALAGGIETVVLPDGDPNVGVAFGTVATFFVVAQLTDDAADQAADQFLVTHITESSSTADDAEADIPLSLESVENVTSSIVLAGVLGDMDRDGDLDLDDVAPFTLALTDAEEYETQYGVPATLHGDIDGDGDLDLDDVDPFVQRLTDPPPPPPGSGSGAAEAESSSAVTDRNSGWAVLAYRGPRRGQNIKALHVSYIRPAATIPVRPPSAQGIETLTRSGSRSLSEFVSSTSDRLPNRSATAPSCSHLADVVWSDDDDWLLAVRGRGRDHHR